MKDPATRSLVRLAFLLVLAGLSTPEATGQLIVQSSLAHDRDVQPGTTYDGTIEVTNESSEPLQAKIYQTDYWFSHEGENRFDPPGSRDRSNAPWIRVGPSVLTVPPGMTVPVNYQVSVPAADAAGRDIEGSYWSMIMIEGIPPESAESTLPGVEEEPFVGLLQISRFGVQVASHVRGTGDVDFAFDGAGVRQDEKRDLLHVNVANVGTSFVRPLVWLELYDVEGRVLGRRDGVRARLYPGTSIRQQFDVSDLHPGAYDALLVVDAGSDDIFGTQYRFELTR